MKTYLCWDSDTETQTDALEVKAVDEEEAAELYAGHRESETAEYTLFDDGRSVCVLDVVLNELYKLRVTGEVTRNYYVHAIKA